jgi:hypothetical protein
LTVPEPVDGPIFSPQSLKRIKELHREVSSNSPGGVRWFGS